MRFSRNFVNSFLSNNSILNQHFKLTLNFYFSDICENVNGIGEVFNIFLFDLIYKKRLINNWIEIRSN